MTKAVWGGVLAIAVAGTLACSTHHGPTTPRMTTFAVVVVDAGDSEPIEGAQVNISAGDRNAKTDRNGYVSFSVPAGALSYAVFADAYESLADQLVRVPFHTQVTARLTRNRPRHPDPVVGAIRVLDGGRCLADDRGCRTFVEVHAGDLALRWMAGCRAACLQDLDDMAAAGYTIVRTWWHIKPGGWPWNQGGDPPYNGLDALTQPNFVEQSAELATAVADRGMRITIGAGGLDGLDGEAEHALMRRFRAVIDRAGAWKFAWTEPVNEPSSIHATTDDDGDNAPGYLRELSRVMTDGTGILWHLGYGSNVDFGTSARFDQRKYTPADQPIGYYHAYRDGHVWDKIRHRFSWLYEAPGDYVRLWVDGEGVGAPTSGVPLRYVSATANGHEMNSPEALALIVAMQSLRGIGSEMSGDGVQRYMPFPQVVGWREIPWLVAQLPRDVHAFRTIHHGGDSFRNVRVLAAKGETRVDGVISDDGRFAYVIYGPGTSVRLPVDRSFTGRLCDPSSMTCQDVSVDAGGELPVSFAYGRLLVGHVR